MPVSLKELAPFRLFIGQTDATFLLDSGFTFSNTDPGGFEAASFQIPRDMPESLRGQPVRLDSGLAVAWEGRISEVQRSLGSRTQITCQGYGALFADDEASMVFVDRDLTKWQQPSYQRQINLNHANYPASGSFQVAADPINNMPALIMEIDGSWESPVIPIAEAWYDAGPENLISSIYAVVSGRGGSWITQLYLANDTNSDISEQSVNMAAGGAITFAPGTPYRFAYIDHNYNVTAAGAQGAQYLAAWQNLAVYGNHGLPLRGAAPSGFYPSDIFGWVLAQTPGLAAGVVALTDSSGYIVPHSVYYTPVTLDTIISDMAKIQGWHWGVWESLTPLTGSPVPRADFRPRPAPGAFTAFIPRSRCDTLDIREDLEHQYNQCTISFSQVDGTQGAVTVTADNPILDQAGIGSRTLDLQGGTMTPATATVFGQMALALTNSEFRVSGSADLIAAVDCPSGPKAPWLLKAGIDRLRIGDLPSTDAWGALSDLPISRVECSLSPSGLNTSVELGAGADLVETIQARLSAATALAAQGGS